MKSIEQIIADTPGARVLATSLPAAPGPAAPIGRDPSRGGRLVCGFGVAGRPAPFVTFATNKSSNASRRRNMKAWQEAVHLAARDAMGRRRPETGPVEVWINFVLAASFQRPPDRDNLCKSATDALQGAAIVNDAQVVGGEVRRLWGSVEGAVIEVWAVNEVMP